MYFFGWAVGDVRLISVEDYTPIIYGEIEMSFCTLYSLYSVLVS